LNIQEQIKKYIVCQPEPEGGKIEMPIADGPLGSYFGVYRQIWY